MKGREIRKARNGERWERLHFLFALMNYWSHARVRWRETGGKSIKMERKRRGEEDLPGCKCSLSWLGPDEAMFNTPFHTSTHTVTIYYKLPASHLHTLACAHTHSVVYCSTCSCDPLTLRDVCKWKRRLWLCRLAASSHAFLLLPTGGVYSSPQAAHQCTLHNARSTI